ncbi:general stress protein 26 [Subtercola boreus]|nr:general stress protein 26 [Subtercola boreus]
MSRIALTMATMNHIVVEALRSDRRYDPALTARYVDRQLRALALEQASMAAHMRRLMAEFPPSFRRSTTISDHHLLVERRVIYSALATELDRLRRDDAFVPAAVDASRDWAWSEIGTAIEARLDAVVLNAALPPFAADPGYAADRDERMRALREVDLPALASAATGVVARPLGQRAPLVKAYRDPGHPEQSGAHHSRRSREMTDSTTTDTNSTDGVARVAELIKGFRFAMMTTRSADGKLVSRPFTVQDTTFDGDLWFIVARDSHEIAEISADPVVNVAFTSGDTWVSLSGRAEQVDDAAKLKDLWNSAVDAWFPDGPEDPNATLVKFESDSAEYWDTPGGRVATVFSLVKSKLTGKPYDGGENEKVEL